MIFFIGILSHLERRQKSRTYVNPYGLDGGGGQPEMFFKSKGFSYLSPSPLEKNSLHLFA